MITGSAGRGRPEPSAGTAPRTDIVGLAVLALVGAAWGAAWQRTAALADIASAMPILLTVLGAGPVIAYLAFQIATGALDVRRDGLRVLALAAGALLGNLLTPGLSPSATVSGRVTGTLDGTALDVPATCTWGAGRTAVLRVTSSLPEHIPPPSGDTGGSFSLNVPTGTLTLELPAGSLVLTDIPAGFGLAMLPLRNGSGDVGQADRAKGSVTLDTGQGAVVPGQLSWSCGAAPAP